MVMVVLLTGGFVVSLVYFLFYLLAYKKLIEVESGGGYECGFEPFCNARVGFSFRFFLIAILFLVFDVEISLMLAVPYVCGSVAGVWVFGGFLVVLVGGLCYEYNYGALDWVE